jgi:uncharacterized OsmC-like protein
MSHESGILNNINVNVLRENIQRINEDRSRTFEKVEMTIEWNIMRNRPQICSMIKAEKTCIMLESELQTLLGGSGIRPSPMQYFLFGVGASYLSTIMLILTNRGVSVSEAKLDLSAEIDNAGMIGVGMTNGNYEKQAIKNILIHLRIKCDLPDEELLQVIEEAKNRCPVLNPINLEIKLEHPS